jgi:hypothetical protein
MNFSEFINSERATVAKNSSQELPHLKDPYLRRYHIQKILATSAHLYLGLWWLRLMA